MKCGDLEKGLRSRERNPSHVTLTANSFENMSLSVLRLDLLFFFCLHKTMRICSEFDHHELERNEEARILPHSFFLISERSFFCSDIERFKFSVLKTMCVYADVHVCMCVFWQLPCPISPYSGFKKCL